MFHIAVQQTCTCAVQLIKRVSVFQSNHSAESHTYRCRQIEDFVNRITSPAIFSFTSSHQPPDAVQRLPEFIQAVNSSNSQSSRNLSCLSCSIAFAILRILGSPAPTYFGSSTGWSPSCISFIHLVSGIGAPSGPSTHLFRKEHSRQQRSPGHLHVAQCIIRFVLVSHCTHLPQVQ